MFLLGRIDLKPMFQFSADVSKFEQFSDLVSCFLNSAEILKATACDGLVANGGGLPTEEYWSEHFVTAFFLLRHSLELVVKAYAQEVTGNEVRGHNIKAIWKGIPNSEKLIPERINQAFNLLAKYHLLEDAQLFRYHVDKKQVKLKDMPPIQPEDFELILDVVVSLQQVILETIDLKKGFPLPY